MTMGLSAIRTRMRDPGLVAARSVDAATVQVLFEYVVCATVWLLVGTGIGLIASIKLHWPEFLPYSWLSFGRVRPVHTNTVLLGWSSLALVGLSFYVVARTSRVSLWSPGLARLALWLWNLALFLGLVTLLAGVSRGPQEYREWVWPLAAILAAAVLIDGYVMYRTVAARALPEIYVSNWYILGAFCYLPILYVTSYLPWYQGGLGNTVLQGYYMHNAMGMWFTQLALGVSYYGIPRLLGRPVYSYALGVLGFWTNLLFYPMIGAHHFIFSPEAWWLQTTAILFSVGMMVPVWAGTGNLLLTFKGGAGAVSRSYALPFFVTGLIGYGLSSTQGTIEAFRSANIYWHFTNFTVGHSHATMYGFIAFIAWGAVYGLLPRLTGREPNPLAVGVHFWLALVGVLTYVIAISVAGVLQGFAWVGGQSFIASVIAAEPMWLWRTIGGLLMVSSHIVFAVNVWTMRPQRTASPAVAPVAVRSHA
ncbi:MAG TPA: cbb3-type cytochrome c oxidase subunit I [Methylomirabilota bacterium]|nr:cbb3-type cytochrome c oxidase subunit I [Methylomirabilota bacterium]